MLIQAHQLTPSQAEEIARKAMSHNSSFVAQLIASGLLSAHDLAQHTSFTFHLPLVDLDTIDLEALPTGLLCPKLCASHKVLPLYKRGNRLVVATTDPTDKEALEQIKFMAQMGIDWVIAEYDKLMRCVEKMAHSKANALENFSFDSVFDDAQETKLSESKVVDTPEIEDAPVVKFLHKMLLDAVHMRASDLHFEPYEYSYRVRFRIDGQLCDIASPPIAIKEKLASRIKVISRLDISEKRVPQDGRMKLSLGPGRVIDFRVSTLPTLFGEKIVIRILDASSAKKGIDALGYEAAEKKRLLDAIERPHGMILVTGPTGSGKTVSLYSCLDLLNQTGINISTAEDPSEINMQGINQVNINEKVGLTFAAALRAFLRQDPDVIMVGEIRDLETADIAIKAAQTGHLVLSTLHTNDAPTTLTRLRNMGIASFNIASSVTLITAQRLIRRLCVLCKQPHPIAMESLLEAGYATRQIDGSWHPYKAVGCKACNQGYQGRVGIYQVMPISEAIQHMILRDASAAEIAQQAQHEGVHSLREAGLQKVMQGITSLEEVLAITNR